MKLDPAVFWNMSMREWTAAQRGFSESENEREQCEWERARWIAFLTLQPYDVKRRINRVTDIAVFDWEEKPDQVMTPEEMEAMAAKLGRFETNGRYHN
jgi:hypothetical protein